MIKLYTIIEENQWDLCVKSFAEWDVYYLSGYVKAFQSHGDGAPFLMYYDANGLRAIYVYMRRNTVFPEVYDAITPYGYGGVLFEGDVSQSNLTAFWEAFVSKMIEEKVVDNFVRYHPVLKNAVPMKAVSDVIDLGKTIALDLTSPEVIWNNIISKNRNMIRKAIKNGVTIGHGKGMDLLNQFMTVYNATMEKDHAEEYYFFKSSFYESIHNDLQNNYEVFYAVMDGRIIAMSIILFANGRMNYHLSGSDMAYRHLAPSNLLLYEAALWGCEQGFKTFHLGGGVGSGEDSLYKFKAAFNKNSDYQFSIGKQIFDLDIYDALVKNRIESDPSFDSESNYFPLYRSEHKKVEL